MKSISLKSPAKLNLYLKVVGKRSDGYHNLITLFERIALCDVLKFTRDRNDKITIECNHPDVPRKGKNLIYQAARLLQKDFAVKSGVRIKITKKIPVAAGLAGGSSNAATTLLALNKIWKLNLSPKRLISYARRLGSDVAFFLYQCSWALGTERGDHIKPLKLKRKLWHLLITPRVKVYSREVFEAFQTQFAPTNILTKKGQNVNILIRALRKNDLRKAGVLLLNDLEATTAGFHPNLLKIKDLMRNVNACGVSLSGSGPTVFGIFSSKKAASKAKKYLRRFYSRVFAVCTF